MKNVIFLIALVLGSQAHASELLELAGYLSVHKCEANQCSERGYISPQDFVVNLIPKPNNDRFGQHTIAVTEFGYRIKTIIKIYRDDLRGEFRVVEIEIVDPKGVKETYDLGTLKVANAQSTQPVKLMGRKLTLSNGDSLTPVVYLGEKGETFFPMAPYAKY